MVNPITRREFAGLVATGTVLSTATLPTVADADDEKIAPAPKPPVSPIELLVELVREKYPDERLTEAAVDEIRSDLRHFLGRSKNLSSFPLANSDEPGFVFSAWRSDQSR